MKVWQQKFQSCKLLIKKLKKYYGNGSPLRSEFLNWVYVESRDEGDYNDIFDVLHSV